MIFTARQLEDLHKTNGQVTLPVGARLTPMASDWARSRKVAIVFDGQSPAGVATSVARSTVAAPLASSSPAPAGQILWWCDGPCGAAKAALAAVGREANVAAMPINAEPKFLVGAVKHLAKEITADRATAGILLVQSGAAAAVYANRCPSLRAILGTCRDAVQQGLDQVGANVLIIETPHQTLQQVRNVLSLFVRMRRTPSEDVKRQLQELASCG
jgi:ribose 5-phosphate isomerase RpiB